MFEFFRGNRYQSIAATRASGGLTLLTAALGLLLASSAPAQVLIDSDGDGLCDDDELYEYFGTDPNSRDTDGDGLDDYTEMARGLPPTMAPVGNEIGLTLLTPNTAPGALLSYAVYYHSANSDVSLTSASITLSWSDTVLQFSDQVPVNLFDGYTVTPGPGTLTIDLSTPTNRPLQGEPLFVVDFDVVGRDGDSAVVDLLRGDFTDQNGNGLQASLRPEPARLVDGVSEVYIPDWILRELVASQLALEWWQWPTRSQLASFTGTLNLPAFSGIRSLRGLEYAGRMSGFWISRVPWSQDRDPFEGMMVLRAPGRLVDLDLRQPGSYEWSDQGGFFRLGARRLERLSFQAAGIDSNDYVPPVAPPHLTTVSLYSADLGDGVSLRTWRPTSLRFLRLDSVDQKLLDAMEFWQPDSLRELKIRWITAGGYDRSADLSALADWRPNQLEVLDLSDSEVCSLAPLRGWRVPNLRTLNLSENYLESLDGLQEWGAIGPVTVDLYENFVNDLTPLEPWAPIGFEYLRLESNPLTDITPLRDWFPENVRGFKLGRTLIRDLNPIRHWDFSSIVAPDGSEEDDSCRFDLNSLTTSYDSINIVEEWRALYPAVDFCAATYQYYVGVAVSGDPVAFAAGEPATAIVSLNGSSYVPSSEIGTARVRLTYDPSVVTLGTPRATGAYPGNAQFFFDSPAPGILDLKAEADGVLHRSVLGSDIDLFEVPFTLVDGASSCTLRVEGAPRDAETLAAIPQDQAVLDPEGTALSYAFYGGYRLPPVHYTSFYFPGQPPQPTFTLSAEAIDVTAGLGSRVPIARTITMQNISGEPMHVTGGGWNEWFRVEPPDEYPPERLPPGGSKEFTLIFETAELPLGTYSFETSFTGYLGDSFPINVSSFWISVPVTVSVEEPVLPVSGSWVYVDDAWAGTTYGTDPDGDGPAQVLGTDSFVSVEEALAALRYVVFGSTEEGRVGIMIHPGVYTEAVTIGTDALGVLRRPGISRLTIRGLNDPRLVEASDCTALQAGFVVDYEGVGELPADAVLELSHLAIEATEARPGSQVAVTLPDGFSALTRALLHVRMQNAGVTRPNLEITNSRFVSDLPASAAGISVDGVDTNRFESLVIDRNEFRGFHLAAVDAGDSAAKGLGAQCTCQENLRDIQLATQQWAFDERLTPDQVPTWNNLLVEGGFLSGRIPNCPAGGTYILAGAGSLPRCTLESAEGFPHLFSVTACSDTAEARLGHCAQNRAMLDRAWIYWTAARFEQLGATYPSIADLVGPDYGVLATPVCPDGGTYQGVSADRREHLCTLHGNTGTLDTLAGPIGSQYLDDEARQELCRSNLRAIATATDMWAMDQRKHGTIVPTWTDLVGEAGYLRRSPVCPAGGVYTLAARAFSAPACSHAESGGPTPHTAESQRKPTTPQDAVRLCQENLLHIHQATINEARRLPFNGSTYRPDVPVPAYVVFDSGGFFPSLLQFPRCPDGGIYDSGSILSGPSCTLATRPNLPHAFRWERPFTAGIHREWDRMARCQEYQRAITRAVATHARRNDLAPGTVLSWEDVVGPDDPLVYQPLCPTGGTYLLGAVGELTTCSHAEEPSLGALSHRYAHQPAPPITEFDLRLNFARFFEIHSRNHCQGAMCQIEQATTKWREAAGQPGDVTPTWSDLVPQWIPTELRCPNQGTYDLTAQAPTFGVPRQLCSLVDGPSTPTINGAHLSLGQTPFAAVSYDRAAMGPDAHRVVCQKNLRLIAGAYDRWRQDNCGTVMDLPPVGELVRPGEGYLDQLPICPSGGGYVRVYDEVRCEPYAGYVNPDWNHFVVYLSQYYWGRPAWHWKAGFPISGSRNVHRSRFPGPENQYHPSLLLDTEAYEVR